MEAQIINRDLNMDLPAEECVNKAEVFTQVFKDDGLFPNSKLLLLVYRKAVQVPEHNPAAVFEELFAAHGWCGSWRNGIYPYHHYHSTTHEVLGVYRGSAKVQLGGKHGALFDLSCGDVLVIPAGVAHKKLGASAEFGVVGAYPEGPELGYKLRWEWRAPTSG